MAIFGFLLRRPLVTLAAFAGIWWIWPDGDPDPTGSAPAQAAVLSDGFAAIDGAGRIVELDDDARRRRQIAVADVPAGARVIGVASQVGLAWRAGKQMA